MTPSVAAAAAASPDEPAEHFSSSVNRTHLLMTVMMRMLMTNNYDGDKSLLESQFSMMNCKDLFIFLKKNTL